MGWLRDLMNLADPPVGGFGELARHALAHPEWPAGTRPQPRSLAALFSKLDRHGELEWLADREAVQRILAATLGCKLESIERELASLREPTTAGLLRLDDVPYARPLNLKTEPLPPGIPDPVLSPARWHFTWWLAPAGSGRSLAGQWLAARGLAEFVNVRRFEEAVERIPEAGPVFVEVERADDMAQLSAWPLRPSICVAAPVAPPSATGAGGVAWALCTSPPAGALVQPLVRWLEPRLPDDGAFDAERAASGLARPIERGELPTLGALLGAAGLLDARAHGLARELDFTALTRAFVEERLEHASQSGSAGAQWLKRHGFDALVRLARAVLTESDQGWEVARSRDEWIALVPAEFRESVDAEWLGWSISRESGQGTARDLERALRSVPPGAYRIVRALIEARLLRSRGASSRLTIAPEFLKHGVLARALRALCAESSPFGWGEALLRDHAAPGLIAELASRIERDDFALLDALLDLDLQSQPALVAALEASFICLGLQLLGGARVPPEALEGIWNEQLSWVVELPGELPRPRLLCREAPHASAFFDPAIWALAALAVGEALPRGRGRAHALLRPWHEQSAAPELLELFDAIFAAVTRRERDIEAWATSAFALAGRLAFELADRAVAEQLRAHPLARPACVVEQALAGALDWELAAGLGAEAAEMAALRAQAELAGMTWPRLAVALYRCWQARGCPEDGDALLGPLSPHRAQLWPHLPKEALDSAFTRWAASAEDWPLEHWGPAQWSALERNWQRHGLGPHPARRWIPAFRAMEQRWAEQLLASELFWSPSAASEDAAQALLPVLWTRFPSLLAELLEARLDSAHDSARTPACTRLLGTAPPERDAFLIARLSSALARRSTPRASIDIARAWLWRRVRARGAEWRAAYALSNELEARVARAARARGLG